MPSWKDRTTKQYIIGELAAVLMAGGLISAAPPASAGCQNVASGVHPAEICDGPVQPDGNWQRCVKEYTGFVMIGGHPLNLPRTSCYPYGPGQTPPPHAWIEQPTHIDDPPG